MNRKRSLMKQNLFICAILATIAFGVFICNYSGILLVVFNEIKIVESMSAEDAYRLQHHCFHKS